MDIRLNIIKTKCQWNILVSQKKVQLNFTVEIHDSNNTKIMTQIDHRLNSNEVVKKYYHAVKKDDCERLDKAYKHFMTLPEHPHICKIKDIHWMENESTEKVHIWKIKDIHWMENESTEKVHQHRRRVR